MTKQCPNCGTEIDKQEEQCPKCGYSFKEDQQKNTDDTSNFSIKEPNENIEWSELKDMSIGHVMTMFNEQQPEDEDENKEHSEKKIPLTEEKSKKIDHKSDKQAEELANTAALDQYINEHKNDKQMIDTPSNTEGTSTTDKELEAGAQPVIPSEDSDSKDKEQDEVKSNEADPKPIEVLDKKPTQVKDAPPKEEITKFSKPDDDVLESKPIGPKALPDKTAEIPSKSKKPEEIEMDAAPIFFKDGEEAKTKAKEPFEKLTATQAAANDSKRDPANTSSIKNYKKMSIILAAVVVLAGGSWLAYSQTQGKSASGDQVVAKPKELATQVEKELNSYFTDDKHIFLKPEMVSVNPKAIDKDLAKLKEDSNYKNLASLYKKVTEKQTAISKVNELFAQPIIDGNKLKDVAIKADRKIDLAKREEKDELDKLLNQATDQAISQYDQLQKAKAAVDVFYQNNELTAALTRESYTTAKAEVDIVKSEALRKPLNEALVKADKALAEAEAVNASQQQVVTEPTLDPANEAPVTDYQGSNAQVTNGVQPDSNTFSAPNADGVYTDPVYSVNANDVSDMSNPAWSWAPGIQEKVIATCIDRGYITAGGYSLQPARIINGEGYYNLFGSDNQYLVTINAKTGWFKGNASRNAGR